jgi:phosphatidylserine synthase
VIIEAYSNPVVYLMTAVIFSTLCVSGLKMFSLKGLEKNIEKNKYQFILLFLFLGLLFINIQLAIPIGVLFYVVLSIFYTLALKLE